MQFPALVGCGVLYVFSSGSLKIGEGKGTLVKIEFLYFLMRAEIKVFKPELWAL